MQHFDADSMASRLDYDVLIPALRSGMATEAVVPPRQHYALDEGPGADQEAAKDATLLVMPAWNREFLGVKLVDVFPANTAHGRPALSSAYVLADGRTGTHLALLDGGELTRRRTVGTAALGASLLSREDARVHLIVGTGHIGSAVPDAYRSVRPSIETTLVADPHNPAAAEALAASLTARGTHAEAVTDLPSAVGGADLITTATLAAEPVIRGEWVSPGTHVDLIGSFRPVMREADPALFARSTVFVDHPVALTEAGEIVTALAEGALTEDEVHTGFAQLCAAPGPRARAADEITVFKTVGTGRTDLLAAVTAYTST